MLADEVWGWKQHNGTIALVSQNAAVVATVGRDRLAAIAFGVDCVPKSVS